jgi:hypothetical protein
MSNNIGDFNAKVGKGDIFKPTTGNESLHEISNGSGLRVVNLATTKIRQKYNVLTSFLTYLRSWTLLEKLPIVQLLKNFPAF